MLSSQKEKWQAQRNAEEANARREREQLRRQLGRLAPKCMERARHGEGTRQDGQTRPVGERHYLIWQASDI